MRRSVLFVSIAAMTSACTLGPDFQRPEIPVPEAYVEPVPSGESIANLPWWELFQDEQLKLLIDTALVENKDLAIALARINEARAALGFTRADQFPFVDGIGRAARGRGSREINPAADTDNDFLLSGDLSFEVDLWGRLRRSTEAARAELLATEEAYRNVTISLVANVASFYLRLRDLDERLAISENTLATRLDSLKIVEARYDKGTVPELDVNQAEIEVAVAEVAVATFKREIVGVQIDEK